MAKPAPGKATSRAGDDAPLSAAQQAKLDRLAATRVAYAKHEGKDKGQEPQVQQQGIAQPGQPAGPAQPEAGKASGRNDDQDALRSKVTGRKEGDAELSDEQQAKLDRLNATRATYDAHDAAQKKERDRGGGGRSGR